MKKTFFAVTFFFILAGLASFAQADLNVFLNDLNTQAASDPHGYDTRLSNQFGIPLSEVHSIVHKVGSPADAFMVLQLGHMTGRPFEKVYPTYKKNRGKGWGVIAKELGIKPGSPEFHALKRGDLVFSGKRGEKGYRHHEDSDWDRDKEWDNDKDKHHGKHGDNDLVEDTGVEKAKGKDKNKAMDNKVIIDSEAGKGKGKGKGKNP